MTTNLVLSARLLSAAAMMRSSEETRYYLKGVYVTPHINPETGTGALMVATDGHRMALAYDSEGYASKTAILDLDFKSKELKTARGEIADRVLHIVDKVAVIKSGYDSEAPQVSLMPVDYIDATYPDFWRVFPTSEKKERPDRSGFNGDYLASCRDAIKLVGASKSNGLQIVHPDSTGPAWIVPIDAETAAKIRFIVMPMRAGTDTDAKPAWLESGFTRSHAIAAE